MPGPGDPDGIEAQRARFTTAYGIIEQADLESEYADWLEAKCK